MQQYSGMFDLNLPIFLSSNNIVSILTHTHVTYYVETFSNISRALHTYTLYYNNRCNVLFLDFRITILQILRRTRMLVKKNISYNINRLTRNDWQFKSVLCICVCMVDDLGRVKTFRYIYKLLCRSPDPGHKKGICT